MMLGETTSGCLLLGEFPLLALLIFQLAHTLPEIIIVLIVITLASLSPLLLVRRLTILLILSGFSRSVLSNDNGSHTLLEVDLVQQFPGLGHLVHA